MSTEHSRYDPNTQASISEIPDDKFKSHLNDRKPKIELTNPGLQGELKEGF